MIMTLISTSSQQTSSFSLGPKIQLSIHPSVIYLLVPSVLYLLPEILLLFSETKPCERYKLLDLSTRVAQSMQIATWQTYKDVGQNKILKHSTTIQLLHTNPITNILYNLS